MIRKKSKLVSRWSAMFAKMTDPFISEWQIYKLLTGFLSANIAGHILLKQRDINMAVQEKRKWEKIQKHESSNRDLTLLGTD